MSPTLSLPTNRSRIKDVFRFKPGPGTEARGFLGGCCTGNDPESLANLDATRLKRWTGPAGWLVEALPLVGRNIKSKSGTTAKAQEAVQLPRRQQQGSGLWWPSFSTHDSRASTTALLCVLAIWGAVPFDTGGNPQTRLLQRRMLASHTAMPTNPSTTAHATGPGGRTAPYCPAQVRSWATRHHYH